MIQLDHRGSSLVLYPVVKLILNVIVVAYCWLPAMLLCSVIIATACLYTCYRVFRAIKIGLFSIIHFCHSLGFTSSQKLERVWLSRWDDVLLFYLPCCLHSHSWLGLMHLWLFWKLKFECQLYFLFTLVAVGLWYTSLVSAMLYKFFSWLIQ